MRELAQLVLRGRVPAVAVAAAAALFPPLVLMTAAVAALVTLVRGLAEGLAVAVAAAALAAGVALALGGSPAGVLNWTLACCLPVWLLAGMLRYSGSLALTVQLAGVAAVLGVVGFELTVGDSVAWWRALAEGLVADWQQASGTELSDAEREKMLAGLPLGLMTGALGANILWFALGGLFLARTGQARVLNPGGFRREMHTLRLGRALAAISAVLVAAGVASQLSVFANLVPVVMALWTVQGLAVAHGVAGVFGVTTPWLVLGYGGLIVALLAASPLVALVPLMGWVDAFANFRGIAARRRRAGGV